MGRDFYRIANAPLPPPKWKGVYKAIDEIYQCPQYSEIGVVGTEDCLKINVYVPVQAKGPLPVMVYIHGGAFLLGNGGKMVHGPEFLVKRDVILVTFNYRLGALGFLCLGIKEAPGNAGLKDQVAALRWVRKNIAAFGGNPDNVTIFGTSAGGGSVSLLVASPVTNGLFHRAIMHSGSSSASWAINYHPVLLASQIANYLGYNTKDPQEIYKIFSKLPYKDLVVATAHKPVTLLFQDDILIGPCVEKEFYGEEAVINDIPYRLLTNNFKEIPLMYSSTDKEGFFFVNEETEESLYNNNIRILIEEDLVFESKDKQRNMSDTVKEYYFGKENISKNTLNELATMYTHLYFEAPVLLEAELMAQTMKSPVYSYYFTYSGYRNFIKYTTKFRKEIGACHGDDIFYTFKGWIWPFKVQAEDQVIVNWLTEMLTNFAKYGNPTPNDLPVRWLPHSKDKINILNIGNNLKMVSVVPNPHAYQFWKDIYSKYRRTIVDYY